MLDHDLSYSVSIVSKRWQASFCRLFEQLGIVLLNGTGRLPDCE